MPFAPKVLGDAELRALGLGPSEIVDAIGKAIRDKAAGRLITTPKSVIQPGDGRYMMTTLATGQAPDVTVVKAVTVCPDNPGRGLPSITGAIMVLDAQTGECLALMDAEWITGVRTAGLSAVAAGPLANPQSEIMGFVGCGVQARSHLEIFAALYPLKQIRLFGRGQANIDALCAMATDLGLQAQVCETPDQVLDGVDIVVSSITITYSGQPFLDARLMKPGSLAIVTDAAKPWMRETFSAFGTVVVDDRVQEENMPDPVVPPGRIAADLAELLDQGVALGKGPRAFMFRGIAAGDYALAARAWQECCKG
ncbi:ornithine cyclodeaminase family protein [Tropicibacter oceani]|uniref:Ornithine cyclodeaminase family protein n=1 Tax=Tropicibacter oceani TaxID=3058420 RepID=A0ABY8QHT1_9RHOB|nr:ornithine cyclodeaminase family protein [Tropicibacter oceani]WGW04170.1 ornithine cyclodeaminase family protein [Tropicibacter oceani]